VKQGPFDNAQVWTQLSASQRSTIKAQYKAAGITLAVSAFGSTDKPTTQGYEPVALANKLSKFVKDYDLDGVDIDYEVSTLRASRLHWLTIFVQDFDAVNSGKSEAWLISFTKQLRVNLPQGERSRQALPLALTLLQANIFSRMLVSRSNCVIRRDWIHQWWSRRALASSLPRFTTGSIWSRSPICRFSTDPAYKNGAYRAVHKAVGDLIDWWVWSLRGEFIVADNKTRYNIQVSLNSTTPHGVYWMRYEKSSFTTVSDQLLTR